MEHLDAQKLSAHLDGALTGHARDETERHLRECAECRAALAELLAQDHALKPALSHDPGDAYYESFSARVEDRIRAAGLRGAQERRDQTKGVGIWQWLSSPRRVALVGTAAAMVVGIGVVFLVARESPPGLHDEMLNERGFKLSGDGHRKQIDQAPTTPAGRSALDRDASGGSASGGAVAPESAPEAANELGGTTADRERSLTRQNAEPAKDGALARSELEAERGKESAPSAATAPSADLRDAPARAYEVRRDEHGEVVRVAEPSGRRSTFAPAPPAPKEQLAAGNDKIRKPAAAQPLNERLQQEKKDKAVASEEVAQAARGTAAGSETDALAKREVTNNASPASPPVAVVSPPSTVQGFAAQKPASGAKSSAEQSAGLGATMGALKSVYRETGATKPGVNEVMLCGAVADTRGRPIANAEVVLTQLSRATTTDAKGAFCLAAPRGSQVLTVMAVGFATVDQQVLVAGESSSARITLIAVPVFERGLAAFAESTHVRGGRPATLDFDLSSQLPDTVRKLVANAESDRQRAERLRSASLLDASAVGFERALKLLGGSPREVPIRYQLAQARYGAWRLGPSGKRARAAEEALTSYLVRATAGAERDSAATWLNQVKR